jgi:hypothetical protein
MVVKMSTNFVQRVAIAAIGFATGVGCGGTDEAVAEATDKRTDAVEISAQDPFCRNGMRTKVTAMDDPYSMQTCTVKQLQTLYDYVCNNEPEVCAFLVKLGGHGRIQCTWYADENGEKHACADVVDRYPDGNPIVKTKNPPEMWSNFFIAFTDFEHLPTSPEVSYWNAMLANPAWTKAPVLLEHVAFLTHKMQVLKPPAVPTADYAWLRLLTFDPRECTHCGPYAGPNQMYVENPGDLATWYPAFTPSTCRFEQEPGDTSWYPLSQTECNDEAAYRATGR